MSRPARKRKAVRKVFVDVPIVFENEKECAPAGGIGSPPAGGVVDQVLVDLERGQYLHALRGVADAQQLLHDMTGRAVQGYRAAGATWEDVGQALGVSRQAAWERWS